MHINKITTYLEALILFCTPFEYLLVTRSNQLLKRKNILFTPLASFFTSVGFKSRVHNAGVRDKAMKADNITDMAIVMANCWYNLPTIPGIKPTGTKTAARIRAIATTGPDISFIA